ncbi:MAG TPA: hypothetical protein VH539_20460 [Gemmatimonadaceae bacterium]|jgi:hypothetical protein
MTTPIKTEPREIVTYPRDAILEIPHVCLALGVSENTLRDMDLPCFYVGQRQRFVWGLVLDELVRRSGVDAQPKLRRVR